jgi:Cd2+/Zn2+-exporting ATPase
MDCAEEVAVLKREVGPVVGGADRLSFDVLNGRMGVDSQAGASPEAVTQAVARTGMRAELWTGDEAISDRGRFWDRHGRVVLTAASGLLGLLGLLVHVWLAGGTHAALGAERTEKVSVPAPAELLYGLGIVAGAWFVLPKAWFAARRLRPDMNLLMTVAIIEAVALGDWFEANAVAFLFALSLAL